VQKVVGVSERRACRVLGQSRTTQRYQSVKPEGDAALVAAMDELRQKHKRCGYRGIWIRLRRAGWPVNRKRVHRVWKAEAWQIRTKRKKRRAKGSSANSCAVHRAEHRGHVWSYDFVLDRTEQGGLLKFLPILDEHTREVHAIEVGRSVQEAAVLAEQFRVEYDLERPHMSLGYLTPAEFAAQSAPPALLPRGAGEASDSPEVGESLLTLS